MKQTIKFVVAGVTALALTAGFATAITRDAAPVKSTSQIEQSATPVADAKAQTINLKVTGMT